MSIQACGCEFRTRRVVADIHNGVPVAPQPGNHEPRPEVVRPGRFVLRPNGEVSQAGTEASPNPVLPVVVRRQRPHAALLSQVPQLDETVGGGRGEEIVRCRGVCGERRDGI